MSQIQKVFSWREAVYSSALKPTTRFVLFYLSQRMDSNGSNCYPSTKAISLHTGLSERAVITNLMLAEQAGFLKKITRNLPGQQWKRSLYQPIWPANYEPIRAEDILDEGTEPPSILQKEGTEPNDTKALKEVQLTMPATSPEDINKKTKGKKAKMIPLAEWEAEKGAQLNFGMVHVWVGERKYDPKSVMSLIEEFRMEMGSKGKLYADFRLAFMTYLTKGYLSKKPHEIILKTSTAGNVMKTRGVSL